jgi:proline iminopeptidase
MGHSEGGEQILHYACEHPNRVNGLILIDSAAVMDKQYENDVSARMRRRKDEPWFAEVAKGMPEHFQSDADMKEKIKAFLPLYWSNPEKAAKHRDVFEAVSMSAEAWSGLRESKRFPFDLTGRLARVKAPALIVVGDDDFICSPLAAKRLHLCLPNSKLLLIEKCGHFPWLEQPQIFFADVPVFLRALGQHPE